MKSKITLLVLACFLTVMACTKKNSTPNTNVSPLQTNANPNFDFRKYALMGLDSPFLRPDSANKMIQSYLDSRTNPEQLKSLIVDADALRYYLNNPDIKHIRLMLAHKMSYVNGGHTGVSGPLDGQTITIVIAGFDANNNYIYSDQGAVMDFCQPCPNDCPQNGTAQYDIFTTTY